MRNFFKKFIASNVFVLGLTFAVVLPLSASNFMPIGVIQLQILKLKIMTLSIAGGYQWIGLFKNGMEQGEISIETY